MPSTLWIGDERVSEVSTKARNYLELQLANTLRGSYYELIDI